MSPGLLLHHETPTKDFFYDEMIPWKHYLPIHRDLSNLRDMYEWAEANPEGAKLIAHEATRFAEYIISPRYMSKIYRELFVDYLGKVIRAYRPLSGKNAMEQWHQLEKHYKDTGHTIIPLSSCDDSHCTTDGGGGIIKKLLYRQAQ
jgi:Glycosyl transferase family 90